MWCFEPIVVASLCNTIKKKTGQKLTLSQVQGMRNADVPEELKAVHQHWVNVASTNCSCPGIKEAYKQAVADLESAVTTYNKETK